MSASGVFPSTDLAIRMGADFVISMWAFTRDANDQVAVWDLTGYTFDGQIRASLTDASALLVELDSYLSASAPPAGGWTDTAAIKNGFINYWKITLNILNTAIAHDNANIIAAKYKGVWSMTLTDAGGAGRVFPGPSGNVTFIATAIQS